MDDWIGETFTSDAGWDHLEDLVDGGNRMAGSPGELEAAEATRDALDAAGARNAYLDEFDVQGWRRGSSAIYTDETTEDSIALPRSPSDTGRGELVDLSYAGAEAFTERDLEGTIVMAGSGSFNRRETYERAVEAGADGFIYKNNTEGGIASTGSVGTTDDPLGAIPAVGVSYEVGERLARRFEGDPVTVEVDADIYEATSQNVHADIGPDTDECVLVTAHVDAHDIAEGALDNAAGTAMVVEMANALSNREDELDTRVEFIVYGAEEVGLRGSRYDAAQRDLNDVKAVLNSDGVVGGRTLNCCTNGFDELADAVETVADRFDHPIETSSGISPHSDHWSYVQEGVPGYHVWSVTDHGGRGWGHTRADTIDKLDSRTLREQAILLTDLAAELARDGTAVEHRDTDDIASQIEDQGLAEGLKTTGEWPY